MCCASLPMTHMPIFSPTSCFSQLYFASLISRVLELASSVLPCSGIVFVLLRSCHAGFFFCGESGRLSSPPGTPFIDDNRAPRTRPTCTTGGVCSYGDRSFAPSTGGGCEIKADSTFPSAAAAGPPRARSTSPSTGGVCASTASPSSTSTDRGCVSRTCAPAPSTCSEGASRTCSRSAVLRPDVYDCTGGAGPGRGPRGACSTGNYKQEQRLRP